MVTTTGPAPSHNIVRTWAIEHGLRASGRWEDQPDPEPEIDEAAAYALADDEPAVQTSVYRRDADKRATAMAALATITGMDVDIPEEVTLANEPALRYEAPARLRAAEAPPEPTWRVRDAKFRAERGIVRRHSKLPPSKTTKGRRDAYLRTLVKQGRFATVGEADAGTPRRPSATRYGREQRQRA
jgi:hypothetical protein